MKRILKFIRYWRWYLGLRTSVMPLGHGAVAVTSGFIGGIPVIVMIPVQDKDVGEPGASAEHAVKLEDVSCWGDLPRGSVVLTFKDDTAVKRHAEMVSELAWESRVRPHLRHGGG